MRCSAASSNSWHPNWPRPAWPWTATRRPACPIRGDEGQLRGAFLNLLRNAREAMPYGGKVTVRTRPIEGAIEVQICDTGGGIPPGDLTRIFEPFYSTKERGTGLGLAFTHKVVEEHGGTIECESELGHGTVFTLKFPATPGTASRRAGDEQREKEHRRPRRQNHEPRAKGPAPRAAAWQSRAETRSRPARPIARETTGARSTSPSSRTASGCSPPIPPGSTRP